MSTERPEQFSQPPARTNRVPADDATRQETTVVVRGETVTNQTPQSTPNDSPSTERSDEAKGGTATVVVRGESVSDQASKPSAKDPASSAKDAKDSPSAKDSPPKESKDKEKAPRKTVSEAKAKLQSRLPALDDDSDVGIQKEHTVVRDGKADLAFTGSLLASAAPPSAPKGQWQEYRIYETNGGKHVFSKVTRSVYAEDQDTHEAEVFDPSPSSVPSQLLRSARDLARSRPLNWMDAAVAFFGYDPLAKTLYRKLGSQFEEHIS
jgi:hypothetical protein